MTQSPLRTNSISLPASASLVLLLLLTSFLLFTFDFLTMMSLLDTYYTFLDICSCTRVHLSILEKTFLILYS